MPSIQIECISCCIKYQHVPASHYETNIEIVKVLEKLSQTLPIQMPQQMMYQQTSNVGVINYPINQGYNGYNAPYNQSMMQYRSPQKKIQGQQQFYGTPTRMTQSHLPGNSYDISQVQQIFEGMRIEAINNSPQTLTKTHSANKSFNQIKDFSHLNVSPQNKSPIRQHLQICTRKGCKNPRAVLENGRIQANYCSKQCDDIDQNKPAFTKNQDEIYRQATRQNGRERSKTPTKHQNYQQSNNYSPLRGNRSKSPNQNRTAYNPLKKQSVFSSDESGFDSDNYRTPQIIRQQTIPFQDYHGQQNDSMIRQLSFDQNSARQSLNQVQLQNSIGTFGDSAFEKFVASQKKDMNHSTNNSSLFDTPSTTTYSQYGSNNNMPFNYGNRSAPPKTTIHQQYAQHLGQDNVIQDAKLDIYLAPTDPSKCINHQCRNRKFLLNGLQLPVCSRKCANIMNIAFNQ
eukprot:403356072